jgi:glycerophosphoryl diester phosphodiesterase
MVRTILLPVHRAGSPTRHPYLDWPGPIPFAHRGGATDAPENTMPAFEHAVRMGYRYLETDVHVTADGVVVAFHDDDLSRTCGRAGRISTLPWSEVAAARVGGTEPIPRLSDLVEAFPDARLNIDCKSDAAIGPLADDVARLGIVDRVCLASFSDRRIRALRRRLGDGACTSMATRELAVLWASGINPGRAFAAQVPVRQGRVVVVTKRFVRSAHRRGLAVHVWTIDEPAEMHRLLDLGVDGLMTDRPSVLKDVFVERGLWHA